MIIQNKAFTFTFIITQVRINSIQFNSIQFKHFKKGTDSGMVDNRENGIPIHSNKT